MAVQRPKEEPPRIKIVRRRAPRSDHQVLICVNRRDWEKFRKIARRYLPAKQKAAPRRGAASAMIRHLVRMVIDTWP